MREGDRRTVRPRWVCEMAGEDVEREALERARRRAEGDALFEELFGTLGEGDQVEPRQEVDDQQQLEELYESVFGDPNAEEHERDPALEHGQRRVRPMLDPKLPSETEVKEHCLTHMPYRNWCPHCVRGRGKEMDHKKRDTEAHSVPEYHMDYCFPGDEDGQRLTILVIIERHSKMKKAVVVPAKGSTGRYASKMVMDLIIECGDKDRTIIIKSDQEPSIKFLIDDIAVARTGAQTIVEQSPVGSKGSNGVVERAVQSVEQYLRTLKSALDERLGVRIATQHPILTWLCEYASTMMNRLEVSADGKTAYERCKGKKAEVLGLEFGEKVLWKYSAKGPKMEKLNARWGYGLFVGVRTRSNELVIVDQETKEIKYVRTVRRVPEEQRWSADNLVWVTMVPWNRGARDSEADGELPEFDVKQGPGRRLTSGEVEDIAMKEIPWIVHRAHLRKTDFDKFGFTDRCPGCTSIIQGRRIQPHTPQCRRRMEKLLEDDLRVKNAKIRLSEKSRKLKEDTVPEEVTSKRQRLDDIEEQAMKEQDPERLAALFEQYREEYNESRGDEAAAKKRRTLGYIEDDCVRTEDPKRTRELFEEYAAEHKKRKGDEDEVTMREVPSSSAGPAHYEGMAIDQVMSEEWMRSERTQLGEYAWDDVNDMELPIDKVKAARKEEMGYMKNKIFKVVKKAEALRVTGTEPISTKWVDTDKSHGVGEMLVRSRWVARDFKGKGEKDRDDLFSATPPLELIRYMLSRQATRRADGRERKTLYIDVKKAHVIAKCTQDVYVELPREAEVAEDECGKLIYWLYGCRPAARAWEEHYSALMESMGFKRLVTSPVAFYHRGRDTAAVVHGDDFIIEGADEELDYVQDVLAKNYEIKIRGRLGSGQRDVREIDMLGRKIRWHEWGVSWEGDDRHKKLLEEYFGFDGASKILAKNGYKEDTSEGGLDLELELNGAERKEFRMLAARLNYMGQDNPSIQFAAKEICRKMACPTVGDFARVKKLVRFVLGVEAVKWEYPWQDEVATLKVVVDSDWAGCLETRRSTSGGLVMLGRHPLRTWSATQSVVALSSAEAELYSMTEGASRGLAIQSMLREMCVSVHLVVATDSSAAKAFAATRGLGRMRHLEVKDLWLQELVKSGRLSLEKVLGCLNPADAMTKYLDRASLQKQLALGGITVVVAGSCGTLRRNGERRAADPES